MPGSKGPAKYPKWDIKVVLEDSRICPLPMITGETRSMLKLHAHYKNGILPNAGGILDQPSAYVEAMNIIENYHG